MGSIDYMLRSETVLDGETAGWKSQNWSEGWESSELSADRAFGSCEEQGALIEKQSSLLDGDSFSIDAYAWPLDTNQAQIRDVETGLEMVTLPSDHNVFPMADTNLSTAFKSTNNDPQSLFTSEFAKWVT